MNPKLVLPGPRSDLDRKPYAGKHKGSILLDFLFGISRSFTGLHKLFEVGIIRFCRGFYLGFGSGALVVNGDTLIFQHPL